MNLRTMHVYAQDHEHDDVWIVGTWAGVTLLRRAIAGAQSVTLRGGTAEVSVSDGEGYSIHVRVVGEATMQKLKAPYTGESSQDHRDGALWPWELEGERT